MAAFCAALFLFMPFSVHAAEVPASADPSRVRERIAPLHAPAPRAEHVHEAEAPQTPVPEGAGDITFLLTSLYIEGMTVYQEEEVRPLYAAFVGRTVSFADLYGIADALTAKYRNDGYILSQAVVPEQVIDGGRARLFVAEGFVGRLEVRGENVDRVRRIVAPVLSSRPLDNGVLERAMLLVNDLPGVSGEAVLSPSPDIPGAADLTVIVTRKRYDASYAVDNRGSRYAGAVQVTGGVAVHNAAGMDESITAQVATAPDEWPDREMTYAGIAWAQPVGAGGTRANVSFSISTTHPGHTLESFDIHGVSRTWSLGLSHPFVRSRAGTLTGSVRLDLLDSERTDNLGSYTRDRLRVLRAGASWQFTDRFSGADSLNVEASQGLGMMGATRKGDPAATRARGEPEFFKATLGLSRVQGLGGTWELYHGLEAQKSAHLLPASEEFGAGGANTGSAYDSSELTGEDGVALRTELRYGMPLWRTQGAQPYVFHDIARVWNRDDAVPEHRVESLADAGFGLRVQATEKVFISLEAAFPMTRAVGSTGKESARGFFAVSGRL